MRVLIVDDEETARYGLRRVLDAESEVIEAATLDEARAAVADQRPDLVLLDLNLGGESGFDLLEELQRVEDGPEVIIITAHGDEKVAVEAMKKGAFDYVAKPFEIDELRLMVRNGAEQARLRARVRTLQQELAAATGYGQLVGTSRAMQRVYALLEKVAGTDATVLVVGESGSGKELVARELHRRSPRSEGALVTVNCAAIPQELLESELFGHERGAFTGATRRRTGKFEQADGGTLFLDEIGDMPADTQAKILRVLEDRTIVRLGGERALKTDARIISATNQDLKKLVEKGDFREDLYYRLEVIQLEMPPLRERREDIPLLLHHFLEQFARRHRREVPALRPDALARLVDYPYPGNVRQLRNIVERLVVMNSESRIEVADLPDEVRFYVPVPGVDATSTGMEQYLQMHFREARQAFETAYLLARLREHDNNITRTARAIGTHRQSLQQKIKDLDLKRFLDK